MTHTLDTLLEQRTALLEQIASLPAFRRGTVLERTRSCGKPSCGCAVDPAHAHLQYQWSVSDHGKTRSRNLHLGPELGKFIEETAAYRRFQELIAAYTTVNEHIADLQPAPPVASDAALAALKKKLRTRLVRQSSEKSTRSSRL